MINGIQHVPSLRFLAGILVWLLMCLGPGVPVCGQEFRLSLHVWEDRNRNFEVDAADSIRKDCSLLLCPGDSVLLPDEKGRFVLRINPKVTSLPLRLQVRECPRWMQTVPEAGKTIVIEQAADKDVDILGVAPDESRAIYGFRHDFYGVAPELVHDSLTKFRLDEARQTLEIALPPADFGIAFRVDRGAGDSARLRIQGEGTRLCATTDHFISAEIVQTDSTDRIAVDFSRIGSDTYRAIAYLDGREGQRIEQLRGRALSLPNNVYTWQFEANRIVLQTYCPVVVEFNDGTKVQANAVHFEPETLVEPAFRPHKVSLSGEQAQLYVYKESLAALGLSLTGIGAAVLEKDAREQGIRFAAEAGNASGVELTLPEYAVGMEAEWSPARNGIPPGDPATLELAYSGADYRGIGHSIAALRLQAAGAILTCTAPAALYGSGAKTLVLYKAGKEVGRQRVDTEHLAEFREWPVGSAFRTADSGSTVSLRWSKAVSIQPAGAEALEADEIRISAPDFGAPAKAVNKLKILTQQYGEFNVDKGGPIIPGQVTITITGNITSDMGAPLTGQAVLVREYQYPGHILHDTLLTTDALGHYALVHASDAAGMTWLSVELPPAVAWLQSSPTSPLSYDLCLTETCITPQVFGNLDFVLRGFKPDRDFGRRVAGGKASDFKDMNEISMPSALLQERLAAINSAATRQFDGSESDRLFAHTFHIPPQEAPAHACKVAEARLHIRLRASNAEHSLPHNDYLILAQHGLVLWRESIATLAGGRWLPGQTAELRLGLDSLLAAGVPGAGLQRLYDDELDVILGDDTAIDFADVLLRNECALLTSVPGAAIHAGNLTVHAAAPNPVERSCILNFSIQHAAPLDIGLYDTRGNRLRSLAEHAVWDSGMHRLYVSLAGQAAGTYFVRFVGEGQTAILALTKI